MDLLEDIEPLPPRSLAPIGKLRREVRAAGALADRDQARFLVDLYYRWQKNRIALGGQHRALVAADKPAEGVDHFFEQVSDLEGQMVGFLDAFTKASVVGQWSRAQHGIGPIIAAGLLAHIDIERAPTVGHIWRFAGLDPSKLWGKGEKRPWNADLQVLCWKLGGSFVKTSGSAKSFYGPIYRSRKLYELKRDGRDENGEIVRPAEAHNQERAAHKLASANIQDPALRACLESGHLSPGQLDQQARRYAVKLFLAHWHEVAYVERYHELPVKPYVLTLPGHVHEIVPPELPDEVVALRRAAGRPVA